MPVLTGGPISAHDPARFVGDLPDAVDAVVIGGGIAGVMSALYLAQAGQRVLLCEKGRIAGEQSSRNWGWVRQQGRDPAELPIMVEAMRLWQGLAQQLGDALSLRQTGTTYLARSARQMQNYEDWLPHARANGLDTRLLSRAELGAMLPNSAGWLGGLTTPSDARAEPWTAVPAMAALAADTGVLIREDCAVRCLQVTNGQVCGVETEHGPVRAARVLLAGGAWSSLFARNAGVAIPQLSVRSTVAVTDEIPDFWAGQAADDNFAFRRRADGGYTLAPGSVHDFWIGPDAFRHLRLYLPQIRRDLSHTRIRPAAPAGYPDAWGTPRRWRGDQVSPFERMRVLDPPANATFVQQVQDDFAQAFPALGRLAIRHIWAGMIDTMPDQVPVLDESVIAGFFIATGLSGHGFGIGPGIGRVMADMMLGRPIGHDLHRFRLSRFSDGSGIALGPTL